MESKYPERRFMRLKAPGIPGQSSTITLVEPAPNMAPTPENHGVLGAIHAVDPKRAAMIQERLKVLIARDSEFFDWIEKDPANATLFARDPVAGIRAALPDLPPDFFEDWGAAPPGIKRV
jgi:hypothetical protein